MTRTRSTFLNHTQCLVAVLLGFIVLHPPPANADVLGVETWTAQYDSQIVRRIDIDFVRGEAIIIRRPGPITISVQNVSAPDLRAAVWLEISDQDDRVSLTDSYPRRHNLYRRECLPPMGSRGDFWGNNARLVTKILAPDTTQINVRYMENTQD